MSIDQKRAGERDGMKKRVRNDHVSAESMPDKRETVKNRRHEKEKP
jgi:hypothetical protein